MSLWKYCKVAFLNHWNLLAFVGGSVFALLSGWPDVLLPLIAAAELAYVGLLGTHPKFQKYVDAQAAAAARSGNSQTVQQTLDRILRTLPPDLLERFQSLRTRCFELRQIASELKHPTERQVDQPFEESQLAGLDRLLWMFLRLLYTQVALTKFLEKTDEREIQREITRVQKKLDSLAKDEQVQQQERMRKTLEDNLTTCQERLANLQKAQENLQLVQAQCDQLENRICSLSEITVNRQEPEFISTQVEHVASSMLQTEQTMNELRFATGLETLSDEPPPLLRPVDAEVVK